MKRDSHIEMRPETYQNRNEDQDRDGVEVLHEVVGHAVAFHLRGLGDEVARELTVADPLQARSCQQLIKMDEV